MARLINNTSYNDSITQSYNEKQQLFSPQYHKKHQPVHELSPTPSSSTLSFLVTDQKSIDEEHKDHVRLPLNTTINTTPTHISKSNYGSLSSEFTYFQPIRSSPAASTISPNDDDEGLYLLWTHQLLRERGYKPSSCKVNDNDEDNDDSCSIDSSITELSVNQQTFTSASNCNNDNRRSNTKSSNSSSYTPSWLSSCFPMC